MIIYAIPDLTGVNISIEQFSELFNHEKIVGVKYTAPTSSYSNVLEKHSQTN